MDQEKETKRQAERCRALAQRIVRELTPASIQVLGGSGALAEALEKAGAQLLPENAEQGTRSEERRVGKECRSRWSPYH